VQIDSKGTSNIKVAVRLRPIHQKEIDDNQFEIVQILSENNKKVDIQKPCLHETEINEGDICTK
jgi:hypothetical protein